MIAGMRHQVIMYGIIMLLAVISLPNKIQPAQYDMR